MSCIWWTLYEKGFSILGGPRVHQLRQDCSEILDCDGIALIALGGD